MLLGVAGRPVLHSRSPQLFAPLDGVTYLRLAADSPAHALDLARAAGLAGINVTAPYKHLLDRVAHADLSAAAVGAANTVVLADGGTAFNTDVDGVREALREAGAGLGGERCVVLGAGGAARAAVAALRSDGAAVTVAARSPERAGWAETAGADVVALAAAAPVVRAAAVVVDCLSTAERVLAPDAWTARQTVLLARYDVVTAHGADASAAGARVVDGRRWLHHQAVAAARHLLGREPGRLGEATPLEPRRTVALVGVSGAGKTTVAAALAARLGWQHADTDALVADTARAGVADVFAREGEAGFRARERDAVARALAEGTVVSTGGGAVLDPGSRALLHRDALVVWLWSQPAVAAARLAAQRDEERPLLAGAADPAGALAAQLDARREHYAAVSHLLVDATRATPDTIAARIADEMDHAWRGARHR